MNAARLRLAARGLRRLALLAALGAASAAGAAETTRLDLRGAVRFHVAVNVSAFDFEGHGEAVTGQVEVAPAPGGWTLHAATLRAPVASLTTELGLRDRHMRERIFSTETGLLPDVAFASEACACRAEVDAAVCEISGRLAIRDREHPFAIELRVVREGAGYRATGTGRVRLSDYGIERPSQLGIRTADEVVLEIEIRGSPAAAAAP